MGPETKIEICLVGESRFWFGLLSGIKSVNNGNYRYWHFLFLRRHPRTWKREVSILCFRTSERGKRKKLLDERHGETKRRGPRSSNFILKKTRILVQVQLWLTSLPTWVVSLEPWILQIMEWSIITWETPTTVHTVLRVTGPHVSHTCPSRHLKVQNYEDTCEVAYDSQKGNEFARQPSLSHLLQDTVNAHSVSPLRR